MVAFHTKYDLPTNCTRFSYGDLDFTRHLEFINEKVLRRFDNKDRDAIISSSELLTEDRFAVPKERAERFMPDLMSEADTQTKMGVSFLCNNAAKETYESFCLSILSSLLFDGPNTPFYKKIIEEGIAPNFCPGFGYDSSTKEATFTMGV